MSLTEKLLRIQQKIGPLTKDSDNPFFKSKYADLNQVLALAKSALNDEGLFVSQGPGLNEHGKYIETSIIDSENGQSISCRVPFSGSEKNMQEIGAAITYARRFGLKSLLAMEDIDDDGETAVGRGSTKTSGTVPKGSGGSPLAKGAGPLKSNAPTAGMGNLSTPVQAAIPNGPSRKTIEEKISLTSKVILDSKRDTLDNLMKMLSAYGVKDKSELSDDQAKKLLTQLEEVLTR